MGFTQVAVQQITGVGTVWTSSSVPYTSGQFNEIGQRTSSYTVTFTEEKLNQNFIMIGGNNVAKFIFR